MAHNKIMKKQEQHESNQSNQANLPKYLTQGLIHAGNDVLCDDVNIFSPDGKKELIKNGSIKLLQGHRYGLIGKNGSGKSTLLNHISEYKLDNFPQRLRVVHIKQEADVASDMKTLDYVVDSDELMKYLENEKKRIGDLIDYLDDDSSESTIEHLSDQLEQIDQRLDILDPRTCVSRAQNILKGLGFTDHMIGCQTKELSGGWRVRAALACALFIKPDILLLDEPTNHLDFPAIDWLTEYMRNYPKCCIVVSHDRNFLNSVITDVIALDELKLTHYKGDYNAYVHVRDENQRSHENLYRKQTKKTEDLQQFIGKAKLSTNQQTADSGAIKKVMLNKMELVPEPTKKFKWSFEFMDPGTLDHPIVTIDDVNFSWPCSHDHDTDIPLFENVIGRVEMNSRIGIMGANGVGKSTLLKLILGTDELKVSSGKISLNPHARIYTFTQHHADQLDMDLSPLEYFTKQYPSGNEAKMRSFLGHYGFDVDLISNKISTLSGGQKSRLAFATMCWYNPHCIIMDEPTNHLDLETVEALIKSLSTYKGGLVTVSHDLYFLQNVVNEIWAINDAGHLKQFFEIDRAKDYSYNVIKSAPDQSFLAKIIKKDAKKDVKKDIKIKKDVKKDMKDTNQRLKSKTRSSGRSSDRTKKNNNKKSNPVSLSDDLLLRNNKVTTNSFSALQKNHKKRDTHKHYNENED
jgi:ATP-binding cassette, subfamily F, member 3